MLNGPKRRFPARAVFGKDEVTICVTDVGLGGLSVMSEIERRLQDNPLFPKVNLLYYNSAVTPGYTQRPA